MIPSVIRMLFDPRGRAGRSELLLAALVMLALELAAFALQSRFGSDADSLIFGLKSVECLIALSATIKRLHDTGRSGLWILAGIAFLCIWTAIVTLGGFFLMGKDLLVPGSTSHFLILGLVMIPAIGMTFWLHLTKGDEYKNQYGVPSAPFLSFVEAKPLAHSETVQ